MRFALYYIDKRKLESYYRGRKERYYGFDWHKDTNSAKKQKYNARGMFKYYNSRHPVSSVIAMCITAERLSITRRYFVDVGMRLAVK